MDFKNRLSTTVTEMLQNNVKDELANENSRDHDNDDDCKSVSSMTTNCDNLDNFSLPPIIEDEEINLDGVSCSNRLKNYNNLKRPERFERNISSEHKQLYQRLAEKVRLFKKNKSTKDRSTSVNTLLLGRKPIVMPARKLMAFSGLYKNLLANNSDNELVTVITNKMSRLNCKKQPLGKTQTEMQEVSEDTNSMVME